MGDENGGHPKRNFELIAEQELRFEVPADCEKATLRVKSGSAEVFGIELALKKDYELPAGLNAAVFTWFGATIELGLPTQALAYTANETPMPEYVKVHGILQRLRDEARACGRPGPTAVIVGPRDCGKTALASTLAAYSVKANGGITVVDLDASCSGVIALVPGTFAVSVVRHLDLEEGGLVHEKIRSVMFGHVSARGNRPVAEHLFGTVSKVLQKIQSDPENVPDAGCLVDMSGDVDGKDGLELVSNAVAAVNADVVFVLDGERLVASIRSSLSERGTQVVMLTKSGGVVSRDDAVRQRWRSRRLREYFYGPSDTLNPFTTVVDFSTVDVLHIVETADIVPDTVLPIGAKSTLDPLKPSRVSLSRNLLHSFLGVSQAESEDEILTSAMFGYVHVSKVDTERNTMTVLAPAPGRLPSRFLVLGSIKWME